MLIGRSSHGQHATVEAGGRGWGGFTLLELMMVLTLILILASFAVPTYHVAVVRAREAVLRDDLYTMRKLIDEFTIDKQRPPSTLDELVEAGYLRGGIPADPFTASNQTWCGGCRGCPHQPRAGDFRHRERAQRLRRGLARRDPL